MRASVSLPYGKGFETAGLPDGWVMDLVESSGPGDLPDPEAALLDALERPVGCSPLSARAAAAGRILLVVSDITRKDGKAELLPWLQAYLSRAGVGPERVDVMLARGTHRAASDAELSEALGAETARRHAVYQHDCDRDLRDLGVTSRGTPVLLNRRLWDYDLLVVVSGVVHHYFAGFGGGCKMIVPGVAGRSTIRRSHALVFQDESQGGGRRPGVEPGRLTGNAVHEDFAEASRRLDRPVFLIDSVRGSRAGRFAGFWAGDLFKAHRLACDAYLGWRAYPFHAPYPLVLSGSGGFPTDRNLVQAHKGLVGAVRLAAPGGVIIHCAECADGLGGEDLERWLAMETMSEMERELRRDYVIYGQTLYALREKAASHRIHLVSRLPPEQVRALGMRPAASLEQALAEVIPGLPPNHATAVFPDGGSLLPVPAARGCGA